MPQGFSDDGQEKGKKKKWWGELFRRKPRKVSDSSSDDEEEDGKRRGFLRRKKHDRGSKDVTNSFVINPGIKQQDRGRSLESVRSSAGGDRTIDRISDRSSASASASKRRLKAKVEASREQLKDSSSDEGSSYTSSLPSGGSFPRRSRIARTERHNRRQLWSASVVYQESNDYDTKFRAKARSATPSPAASPKIKPRAASQDSVAPPPPPRRMEIPKYQPPVYTAPNASKYTPRYNGLSHHSSDPVIPKDWNEDIPVEEKKPPAPPRRQPSQEERKRQAHLEEALNELEAIYKKLEDLQDNPNENRSEDHRAEDDMAYRKLNKREPSCQDVREIISQAGSFLLVSPTLSPPSIVPSSPNGVEPDVTYDDVVYRTINHSNNTLKCLDPQPPFGIPLGPISPAPSSDYLHAKPTQFELKPPHEPDIVTDDLAYRNLRKDNQELRKKKAVRSLSANLSNVIFRNNNNISSVNNNNLELDNKSQSYSDIPEEMRLAQRVLDMRRAKKNEPKVNVRPQLPRVDKEEMRRKFFADVYDNPSETDLLKELEDEARATSLEIEQQLSKQKPDALYSRSMTDLLEELTKNLDYDFGQTTTSTSCQTCGDGDSSKISRGSSNSFHSHASPPMKSKTVARAASHHSKPESPKTRSKLQSAQSAPLGNVSTSIKDRPRFPLPHEHKENIQQQQQQQQQEEKKSFTPYRSPNSSVRILRDSCENLPKIRKKVDSRLQESAKTEDRRTGSPRNVSPRSSNALDELFSNLSNYKPEGPPKFKDKPSRAEHRSSSLKIQSETPRPWEGGNFKGRSDSYHGPIQMRASTPKQMEMSPNTRRRLSNSSPKRMDCSPNNSFRRRTPSPGRHNFRSESPSQWEKSLDELCKFQDPYLQQVQQSQQKRESPRPWLSRQSPIEREGSVKDAYRLSPHSTKSQSPKPWMGYNNSNEGQPMPREHHQNYPLSVRRDSREGSRSPKPWPMPLSVGRSLDEGSYLASERVSPKPRWSSVRERVLHDHFHSEAMHHHNQVQQPHRRESPKNWQPQQPPNELIQPPVEFMQRASPAKRTSQESLFVPEFHIHRPVISAESHQHPQQQLLDQQQYQQQQFQQQQIHQQQQQMQQQQYMQQLFQQQQYQQQQCYNTRESPKQQQQSHSYYNRESPKQQHFQQPQQSYNSQDSPKQQHFQHQQSFASRESPIHQQQSSSSRESPKRMIPEFAIQRAPSDAYYFHNYRRESPQQLTVEPHPLQRNLSNEILSYGYQRDSPSQAMFEMRRHSNDEGYRRSSPRLMHMVSEHGQRVVNSQLLQPTHIQAKPVQPSQMHHSNQLNQQQHLNQLQQMNQAQQPNQLQLSYKRDTPSPRWGGSSGGSLEEKGSPPLKIKHPAPWRHSISGGADRADMGRQSPQNRQSSPVRTQRSQLRDQESSPPSSRLVKKVENARTWEDLNSFYNKLSETRKIGSSSWESLDDKEVKSSPELKINELTVGYPDGVDSRTTDGRSKTPESRRKGSSPKELSPSLSRKEFANQLGVIGENRIVKRDSLSSPLFRSPSSVGRDDDRRHSPPTHDFASQLLTRDSAVPPRQSIFNTSPIDVAAMEADCNDDEDDSQGAPKTPATGSAKENVQKKL